MLKGIAILTLTAAMVAAGSAEEAKLTVRSIAPSLFLAPVLTQALGDMTAENISESQTSKSGSVARLGVIRADGIEQLSYSSNNIEAVDIVSVKKAQAAKNVEIPTRRDFTGPAVNPAGISGVRLITENGPELDGKMNAENSVVPMVSSHCCHKEVKPACATPTTTAIIVPSTAVATATDTAVIPADDYIEDEKMVVIEDEDKEMPTTTSTTKTSSGIASHGIGLEMVATLAACLAAAVLFI